MANVLYDRFKLNMLTDGVKSDGMLIGAVLVNTNIYTFDPLHEQTSDLEGAVIASAFIQNVYRDYLVIKGDNTLFPSVTGDYIGALVYYEYNNSTLDNPSNKLIGYIDNSLGLPLEPSGNNILIRFPSQIIYGL